MRDEQLLTENFELLVGVSRAQRLLHIYINSHPYGTQLDFLLRRGRTKEQMFTRKAQFEGFNPSEISAFLELQS